MPGLDDPVFDVASRPTARIAWACAELRAISPPQALAALKPLAVPQIEGSFPCPVPIRIEDPEGCPAFFGRAIRGREERRLARVDAAPAQSRRPAADLGAGRHHQLCDARATAARPCLRYRQAERRPYRARRAQGWREGPRAQREGICARTVHDGDRRRRAGPRHRRDHGRRGLRASARTTTDVMLEVAYFTPERIARTGQALGLTSDARTPLRARRRSGLPRRRAGDPDRADPRHLRRRAVGRGARGRTAGRTAHDQSSISAAPKRSAASTCPRSASARSSRASGSR